MLIWAGFIVLVLIFLAFDLGVLNREAHVVSVKEALAWTAMWIGLALVFNVGVYYMYKYQFMGLGVEVGNQLEAGDAAMKFLTGYIIEKSLSLDNIFIIALIFSYFKVPPQYQHRTLFWGILGAMVMRGVMIAAGAALIRNFSWIVYVFGALLLVTAVRMMISKKESVEPEHNPLVRAAKKVFPVHPMFEGEKFFTRHNGKRAITPMFLVLIMIESTDLMFAVDSIPAIFAVTTDTFIVFTSNIFAILGLRALYFALAGIIDKFRYLKAGLVFLLAFVGVKMLLTHHYHIPTPVSLAIVGAILAVSIVASIVAARKEIEPELPELSELEIPEEVTETAMAAYRRMRKILITVIGGSLVLVGVAMIFLPGPAMIVIPMGLAILATEFIIIRRFLCRLKDKAGPLGELADEALGKGICDLPPTEDEENEEEEEEEAKTGSEQ